MSMNQKNGDVCRISRPDDGGIHCLMIDAAGVGKTANFLYPNIEYTCAYGISFLCTDTKAICSEITQEHHKELLWVQNICIYILY